jgi:endonuclease G, mitochondrial
MSRRILAVLAVLAALAGATPAEARRRGARVRAHQTARAGNDAPHGFAAVKEGWRSPAGLIYRRHPDTPYLDGVSAVLMHMRDAPDRPLHGVFHSHPLKLIDEAWRRVKSGARGVTRYDNRAGHVIEIDMGHSIGWLGGQAGATLGRPRANHLRLVLDDRGRLMSAYPHRPHTSPLPLPKANGKPNLVLVAKADAEPKVFKPKDVWQTTRPLVPHTLFGKPSNAGTQPNDFLLDRERYVLSYNRERRVMNWASWSLVKEDFGHAERQKDFRHDTDIPDDWGRIEEFDYSGSQWTRGHMVPSGETTASPHLNSSTYLMTNIVPQATNVNSGPWNKLENWYRDQVRFEGKDAHLTAGTIFNGPAHTIGNGVQVPTATWKIVVLLERGQTLANVNARTRVIATIMPNSNSVSPQAKWYSYRTSVAEIEKQTGLRFFSHLPPAVADVLRGKVDRETIIDEDHPRWRSLQKDRAAMR